MFAQLEQRAWISKITPLTSRAFVAICDTSTSLSFFYSVGQGASLFARFVRAHHTRERMVGALTIYSLCLFDLQIAHFETQYGKISSKPANSPKPPIQPQTHKPLLFLDQTMLFLCDSTVLSLWGM
jgi:hypothetical protein